MSISNQNNRNGYVGNNATSIYNYTFKILKDSELKVTKRNLSDIETVLTKGIDFTVSGVGNNSGGTITLTAGNLPTDFVLVIERNLEFTQELELRNAGDTYLETIEDAFDRVVMLAQQLKAETDRSIKLAPSVDPDNFDPTMPVATGAYRMLMINENNAGFALGPTPQELSDAASAVIDVQEAADAAAASEIAAANSATAAANSATSSATSATNSASSATASSASATAASNSATSAATSATSAASHDILYGSGAPSNGLGVDGNSYINTVNGSFYQKASGTWTLKVTLTGSGGVSTFNGRAGAVSPQAGDYTKADVGLSNVDNTSDAVKNSATATLTNKTLTAPVISSPTGLVKADVGLSNVDNTADANKPVSTAQAAADALNLKITSNLSDLASPGTARTNLGLGNVDNTSDVNKPVSTAQTATFAPIAAKVPTAGTMGQVLTKNSNSDYDVSWVTPSAGASSPLTTKGDLFGFSSVAARLPVGSNNQILTADSTQTLGVKWAAPAAPDLTSPSGTLAIANGGTGQTTKSTAFDALSPMSASGDIIYGGTSGTGTRLAKGSNGSYLTLTAGVPAWTTVTPGATAPKLTKYTSGSGTHTLTGSPLYIRVRMVGGGGGGGGSGTSGSTAGGNGGNTTFGTSLLVANGATAGTGGTASVTAPAVGTAVAGGSGGSDAIGQTNSYGYSGSGGTSPFGGAGNSSLNTGKAASTNSGSGGGAAGTNGIANNYAGIGGGAGGYVDAIITSPSASYSYAVGTGGAGGPAGSSGFAGGAGGAGYIEITEYYQ